MKPAFLKGIKLGSSGLRDALNRDLARVEDLIQSSLRSEIPFIQDLNATVLAPRGKRLRPALVILAADSAGDSDDATLLAGAVVEMIHTATLLHDDVVDGSMQRRGRPTLNAENGDGAAILMGDFVYSRAITLLVEAELTQVLSLLATTVHRMSVGELLQLEPGSTITHGYDLARPRSVSTWIIFEAGQVHGDGVYGVCGVEKTITRGKHVFTVTFARTVARQIALP